MDARKPFLKSFTVNELMQFIDHYMEHREMLHVPGHPWEVCDLVARFLGFGYSKIWTQDEINILRENYPALGTKETSKLILLRTAYDCQEKAKSLGLISDINMNYGRRRDSWSVNEIEILLKYYPIIGPKTMILLPGRSEGACMSTARISGIAAHSSGPWSVKEIEILKQRYPQMGASVGDFLPGRTPSSIRTMARKMSIRAPSNEWTAEEDALIRAYYSREESSIGPSIVDLLHNRHSKAACRQQCHSFKLKKTECKNSRLYTQTEVFNKPGLAERTIHSRRPYFEMRPSGVGAYSFYWIGNNFL